jgi:hypothetical protein
VNERQPARTPDAGEVLQEILEVVRRIEKDSSRAKSQEPRRDPHRRWQLESIADLKDVEIDVKNNLLRVLLEKGVTSFMEPESKDSIRGESDSTPKDGN